MSQARNPNNPPLRRLNWKEEYLTRHPESYSRLDYHLKAPPGCSLVDGFLNCWVGDLEPPWRHEALRMFLERTGEKRSFPEALRTFPSDKRCLAIVDDRSDPLAEVKYTCLDISPVRRWESQEYNRFPPKGLKARVYGADAEMLYNRLREKREGIAERRIIYLVDLTPLMALALISNVAYLHLPQMRSYLSKHVGFNTYMGISQRRGFVLEFHLPHYVLRRDKRQLQDARGLRKHRYFRPPSEDEQNCIYEAQLSLIVLGEDDFFWTAYFCEDSYFTGGNPVHRYLEDQTDGPTGALRPCNRPIWDPRYYFLAVLSTRMEQVTMEWTALVQFMENYLDPHSEINPENLSKFLEDDPALKRTKEYTWVLCILRRLRNSLAKLISTWKAFDLNHSVYFDLDAEGNLQDHFREHFSFIRESTAELGALHMILEHRIETLEKMSSLLVNASALAESITATIQGDHIRLLTYITILYLPMTLVTGAFSMNQVTADVAWWKYWVALVCLTGLTVGVALGLQVFVPRWKKDSF